MSDHLDDRIRQLFEEADSAAPEPPPMPALPTSAPTRPVRWLVPVVGLAMAVLVLGLVATLVGGGAEDAGEATGTTAPSVTTAADGAAETTAAPADTAAPETTSAAETTEAMDGDGPDPLILLGAGCSELIDEARDALTSQPSTAEDYRSAAEYLEPFLSDLVADIDKVASDTGDPDLQGASQRGETVLDITDTMINEADDDELPDLYTDLRRELEATAVFLEDFGASDCSGLGDLLP